MYAGGTQKLCQYSEMRMYTVLTKMPLHPLSSLPTVNKYINNLTLVLYICFKTNFRINITPPTFVTYIVVDAQLNK